MRKLLLLLCLLPLIGSAQNITTYAGGGTSTVDNVPATVARLYNPCYGTFDKHQNYFVSSMLGHKIFKVNPSGIITTVAGTDIGGYNGDGISAITAQVRQPGGLTTDTSGNIFFCDVANNRIRKINSIGIISTVVGTGTGGFSGDGGPAISAEVYAPNDLCFDKYGNMYVADYINQRVRKITVGGVISTFAGNGLNGYSGDGCRADTSRIGAISGICSDSSGNVYLASVTNSIVIKVLPDGSMVKIAGVVGSYTYVSDGIPAVSAQLYPGMIGLDSKGFVYIADQTNNRVRKIDEFGIIHTVAGNGIAGFSGDGGAAVAAQMIKTNGVAFDSCDNLYIPEAGGNRVRKVTFDTACGKPSDTTNHDVGIADVSSSLVNIYPNPVYDFLTVEVTDNTDYSLLSISGAVIRRGTLHKGNNSVPVGDLSAGMYLLQLRGEDGRKEMYKMVKQ